MKTSEILTLLIFIRDLKNTGMNSENIKDLYSGEKESTIIDNILDEI